MTAAVLVRGGGIDVAASPSSSTASLIGDTVPSSDDAPVCTVPHAGVDLVSVVPEREPTHTKACEGSSRTTSAAGTSDRSRDYFPQPRASRPPADAPTMVDAVAAIVKGASS